ncbi:MAG: YMGG-like glycine zipper-containing protein [Terriglobia bacterium]
MKRAFPLIAAMLLLSVLPVWATTVQLRDGTLIEGTYLGGTKDSINLTVNGKLETYPVSKVLLLEFGTSSTPVTSPNAVKAPAAPIAATVPTPSAKSPVAPSIAIPAGTQIEVRMIDTIDSEINKPGDTFQATLEQPLQVGSTVVAPKDANVYGRLVASQQAGRLMGRSQLRLELTGIEIAGKVVPVVTSDYDAVGKSRGKQTAARSGIGAGLGALIGAITGGGKGAAVGAAVGGGAGAASQVITHGEDVHIPSETVLNFTLAQPLTVQVAARTTP